MNTFVYQATIAKALLPTLRLELEHLSIAEIIRRPRESDVRATCGEPHLLCSPLSINNPSPQTPA
jgi:hypothetical protein